MKYTYFYFLLLTNLMACQSAPDDPREVIEQQLAQVYQDHEMKGLSVGLIANDELYYSGSFGLAHKGRELPMTPHTYHRIASISKFFTSMAVMTLWEQGLVNLDTPVSNYLGWELKHPAFPEQPITLGHLMDHRSGITDGEGYGQYVTNMITQKAHIRNLFMPDSTYYTEDMFSQHAPGSYFQYANCTWGLVATVIERVSGQRFDQYCKENLFDPMGIKCSYNVADIPPDQLASLYRYQDQAWVVQVDDYGGQPAPDRGYTDYVPGTNGLIYAPQGGLRASLNDLWITAQMIFNQGKVGDATIIKPETLEYFQQDPWVYDGQNGETWNDLWLSYTKGMHFITNQPKKDIIFPDRSMWGHAGIAYGLLSDFYMDPATQSGVIFITNGKKGEFQESENSSFYQVEEAVFNILYSHLNTDLKP